jgi:hypothetical protein
MSENSVFISYRHESAEHVERVTNFASRLETAGVRVILDHFANDRDFHGGGPDEGWPKWISSSGLGAAAEATVIGRRLYNAKSRAFGIRIVELSPVAEDIVPLDLQGYQRFCDPRDFDQLVRWLNGTSVFCRNWPDESPPVPWLMADNDAVRVAFERLITCNSEFRYLPIRGEKSKGKTHITNQLLGSVLGRDDLACGRFDFKGGCADVESQLQSFVQDLDVPLPPKMENLGVRFGALLSSLIDRKRPALVILDTFEEAGSVGSWVCTGLLHALIKHTWLRVVITGSQVPEDPTLPWARFAHPTIRVSKPTPEQWFDFGRSCRPETTLEFDLVAKLYAYVDGDPPAMAQVLGRRA